MRTSAWVALVAVSVAAVSAAEVEADEWYVAAKIGPMIVNRAEVNDPINAGIQLGHKWTHTIGQLGIEAEYTNSVNRGRAEGEDLSVETATAYGVFRTAGAVYLKARLGMSSNTRVIGDDSSHGIAAAAGAGIGFQVWYLQLEFAYTRMSQDLDFISFSVQF